MQEPYDKEVIEKTIKGFQLVRSKDGFGYPFITKNGKATPALAERINQWIVKTFPGTTIRVRYEQNYGTVNFLRKNF